MITVIATTINTIIIYFEGAHMPRSLCKFIISSIYFFPFIVLSDADIEMRREIVTALRTFNPSMGKCKKRLSMSYVHYKGMKELANLSNSSQGSQETPWINSCFRCAATGQEIGLYLKNYTEIMKTELTHHPHWEN